MVEKLSSLKRGQVVVFKDPGRWLTGPTAAERGPVGRAFQFVGVLPDPATEHLIKRVIGVPGDQVVCCDAAGRITVNGQPLDESGYLYTSATGETVAPSSIPFEVVVPKDHIFVMGDNRNRSSDSRCHLNDVQAGGLKGENAFVAEDLVVGRAMAVVWPFDRRHRLPIPDTFKTVPPGSLRARHSRDLRRTRGQLLTTHKPDAAGRPRTFRRRSAGRQALSFAKELLIVVVGAIIVSSLLRAFVGQMFIIPSESMESTLLEGDRVVVQKITDFERGAGRGVRGSRGLAVGPGVRPGTVRPGAGVHRVAHPEHARAT